MNPPHKTIHKLHERWNHDLHNTKCALRCAAYHWIHCRNFQFNNSQTTYIVRRYLKAYHRIPLLNTGRPSNWGCFFLFPLRFDKRHFLLIILRVTSERKDPSGTVHPTYVKYYASVTARESYWILWTSVNHVRVYWGVVTFPCIADIGTCGTVINVELSSRGMRSWCQLKRPYGRCRRTLKANIKMELLK
jgi:hypothetical protein